MAFDPLDLELQAELELLQEETLPLGPDVDVNAIFSSSEADYKLFELPDEGTDSLDEQNEAVWSSYFGRIQMQQQKYLHDSQHLLTEMKKTCADTVAICESERPPTAPTTDGAAEEHRTETLTATVVAVPRPVAVEPVEVALEEDIIITFNPCVPSHVISEATPSGHRTAGTSNLTPSPQKRERPSPSKADASAFLQHLVDDNLPSDSLDTPSSALLAEETNAVDDYQAELEKLEQEMEAATAAHEEEMEADATVKWSAMLQQSKELYDEYLETTRQRKRDQDRLVMVQYFSGWKVKWDSTQKERRRMLRVTQDMHRLVLRMVNRTVIRYQNSAHRLNLWRSLLGLYRHHKTVAALRAHSLWKHNVTDYIVFHFERTYDATMRHRAHFRAQCIPSIPRRARHYQQRRRSALKISKWYRHRRDRRRIARSVAGIAALCVFRKCAIEQPLKHRVFSSWTQCVRSRRAAIQKLTDSVSRRVLRVHFARFRRASTVRALRRQLTAFRATRTERTRYRALRRRRRMRAALCIQSYFRMSHVRSIFGAMTLKLSSIRDLVVEDYDFKELEDTEFLLDWDSTLDGELKPLSNPPSPRRGAVEEGSDEMDSQKMSPSESDGDAEYSESARSSDSVSSSKPQSEPDAEPETEGESASGHSDSARDERESVVDGEGANDREADGGWKFENDRVAKAWMMRKKRFRPKKKKSNSAMSRLSRFNKAKQHNARPPPRNRKSGNNKAADKGRAKPKYVKFGCP